MPAQSDFLRQFPTMHGLRELQALGQHLQMVQMRAKENGRWFIRATNTGVTAFIDHQGIS